MNTCKWLSVAVAAVAAGTVCGADVLYKDDFRTRVSKEALPDSSVVHELHYVRNPASEWTWLGRVISPIVQSDDDWKRANMGELYAGSSVQDGWIMTLNGAGGHFLHSTNSPSGLPSPGNSSIAMSQGGTTGNYANFRTPLYNRFTSGILEVSFDLALHKDATWEYKWGACPSVSLGLGDDVAASPLYADKDTVFNHIAMRIGFTADSASSPMTFYASTTDADGTSKPERSTVGAERGVWYRFTAQFDIGNERFDVQVRKVDDSGNAGTEILWHAQDLPFNKNRASNGLNGISTLVLARYFTTQGSVDNVNMKWRAAAGAEAVTVYENDMDVRRLRQVSPAATATFDYGAIPLRVNAVTNRIYEAIKSSWGNNDAPSLVKGGDRSRTEVQAPGYGGWRRINSDGFQEFHVIANNAIANGDSVLCLRAVNKVADFGAMTLLFGQKITSGIVKGRVDIFAPAKWNHTIDNVNKATLWLASEAQDQCLYANWSNFRAGYVGIGGGKAGSSTDSSAYAHGEYISSGSTTSGTAYPNNRWYRVELEANLDTKQVTETVTLLDRHYGLDETLGTEVTQIGTGTGAFMKDISDISSVVLTGYGSGTWSTSTSGNPTSCILYDNLRITKKASVNASEELVYENDFDKAVARVPEKSVELSPFPNSAVNNPDGWYRRNNGMTRVVIEEDAQGRHNVRVSRLEKPRNNSTDYGVFVKSLGREYRTGKITARVDVRPPLYFAQNGGYRSFSLALGDSVAWQGSHVNTAGMTSETFGNHHLLSAGFVTTNEDSDGGVAQLCGRYYGVVPSVEYGSDTTADRSVVTAMADALTAAQKSHWIRIEATAWLDKDEFDVRWYDMGADQPDVDAPKGTLIHAETGHPLRVPLGWEFPQARGATGVSSVAIKVYGAAGHETTPESARLRFTNVVVEHRDPGTVIMVR